MSTDSGLIAEARTAVLLALPAFKRDEIEQLDNRWRHWYALPEDRCRVPETAGFTPSDLLTEMAAALIEDHPGAFGGITDPPWEYGWYPKPDTSRCWLLKPSERQIALNSVEVIGAGLTNRQVRVQLHEAMVQAEHGISRILDRIAQPRRPKGASNQQLRLIGE